MLFFQELLGFVKAINRVEIGCGRRFEKATRTFSSSAIVTGEPTEQTPLVCAQPSTERCDFFRRRQISQRKSARQCLFLIGDKSAIGNSLSYNSYIRVRIHLVQKAASWELRCLLQS